MIAIPPGAKYFPTDAPLPPELAGRLPELAAFHGDHYASYLAVDPGWEYFWLADGKGTVAFTRWAGRYVIVVSGLLAPEQRRAELLDAFLEFVRLNRWQATFYNIGAEHREFVFGRHGKRPVS